MLQIIKYHFVAQRLIKPINLSYHKFMRISACLLGILCFLALPSTALASSTKLLQQIGTVSAAPDLQDSVSEIGYGRADGPASTAELYFPAQLMADGDQLLFTEYNSVLRPRSYILGGALRAISRSGKVSTLALSKKMALTSDRMTGLDAAGGIIYTTLGESIISLPKPDKNSAAERVLGFPSSGVIREIFLADTLGSDELPYDTLAGDPIKHGDTNGIGQAARFSYPYALSLYGDSLLVADRDNNALRRVDLTSGQSYDLLNDIPAPVALAEMNGTLYIGSQQGIYRLDLVSCSVSKWSGCQGDLVPVKRGVTALAVKGSSLVAISPSGIYAYNSTSGSLVRMAGPSSATRNAGGAAFWQGRLYISDFSSRVIRAFKVKLPEPVKLLINYKLIQDGVMLSPALSGPLPYKPSFSWRISAPGCTISERGQARLVSCSTPRISQVSLSFSGPGVPGRTIKRQIAFR